MLIIAKQGKENLVREIFEKWDVPCAEIGRVTDDGLMRVRNNGSIAAEIPARALADAAPLYSREAKTPNSVAAVYDRRTTSLAKIDNHEALRRLLRDPTIASKNWVYRQYDHTVRTGTIVKPGSDAAVFFVRYANKILAATTDCNSFYCALDPREGGKIAVAEAARNLTCSGARPLAVTDNLNFGNPYKPENFWQLREAVEGIAEACRAFDTPVTGGNVSLYNESPAGVVDPTPTIAMVGLIDDESHITTQWFKNEDDVIILVGTVAGVGDPGSEKPDRASPAEVNALGYNLGGSSYLKVCHGLKIGPPPRLDLELEIKVQNAVRDLIRAGLVRSAHDCSEGGLGVALAECCFNPEQLFGAEIELCSRRPPGDAAQVSLADQRSASQSKAATALFNESQSRVIISVAPEDTERTMATLREYGVPFQQLGKVGGDDLCIRVNDETFRWAVTDLHDDWFNAIRRAVEGESERIPSL
jgi:phosphoribosylformylglycinamidine synthase